MSDIKLFDYSNGTVRELELKNVDVEKKLQTLIENNMETFLGVRFLASEYSTGNRHRGRIDSLGLDENNCPVIIEYKRDVSENVINQGLFYLDWLMEHQAEFQLFVQGKFGEVVASNIDWSVPRLLCIAADFTRYDEHAVQQIERTIELIRYRLFDERYLLFELVNVPAEQKKRSVCSVATAVKIDADVCKHEEYLAKAPDELVAVYKTLCEQLHTLGEDVQVKQLKHYLAFKRLKNFATVVVNFGATFPNLYVYTKADLDSVEFVEGFTRDVSKIGHWGTGELEITIRTEEDIEKAMPLFRMGYERS